MQALEEFLDTILFQRMHRSATLTREGERYHLIPIQFRPGSVKRPSRAEFKALAQGSRSSQTILGKGGRHSPCNGGSGVPDALIEQARSYGSGYRAKRLCNLVCRP